jgi:hypothetical protein
MSKTFKVFRNAVVIVNYSSPLCSPFFSLSHSPFLSVQSMCVGSDIFQFLLDFQEISLHLSIRYPPTQADEFFSAFATVQ